jgi:hypothetical protein
VSSGTHYVARNAEGGIVAIFDRPQAAAPEQLKEQDPEMIAFVTGGAFTDTLRQNLLELDADLLRILEDLINVLVDNNVILLTDFPDAVQRKLMNRQKVQDKLRGPQTERAHRLNKSAHKIDFIRKIGGP